MNAINFNEVFLTNSKLRKQVAQTLRNWGLGENPVYKNWGICGNLRVVYPEYSFDQFIMHQSLNWPHHKMAGNKLTSFPVCDLGYSSCKWQNPQRLDLCRYLAKLLESVS